MQAAVAAAPGDTCNDLVGQWVGNGTVKSRGVICEYRGEGSIDQPNDFTLDLPLTKTSGGVFCPKTQNMVVQGRCSNGNIIINDGQMALKGTVNGSNAELSGKLKQPTADAEVSLHKK